MYDANLHTHLNAPAHCSVNHFYQLVKLFYATFVIGIVSEEIFI